MTLPPRRREWQRRNEREKYCVDDQRDLEEHDADDKLSHVLAGCCRTGQRSGKRVHGQQHANDEERDCNLARPRA